MGNIKQTRFDGLICQAEFYYYRYIDGFKLSQQQRKQLNEIIKMLYCFGEYGEKWAELLKNTYKIA